MPPKPSACPPLDEELQDALRCVAETMAIGGFILTRVKEQLIVTALKGEIPDDDVLRIVLEMPAPGGIAIGLSPHDRVLGAGAAMS